MYPKPNLFSMNSPKLTVMPVVSGALFENDTKFIKGIYELFSNSLVIKDHPEKRIDSLEKAEEWILQTILTSIVKLGQAYVIKENDDDRFIGVIEVIFYERIGDERKFVYRNDFPFLEGCCEIEFWLHPDYWNDGIMTLILHQFVSNLLKTEAVGVVATVLNSNEPSLRVLEKLKFKYITSLVRPNGAVYVHLGKM